MEREKRAALLRDHPERYATTGLDWGNPAHYETIANGLFQALMGVLARQQGLLGHAQGKVLRQQQARIEQRLSVAERAAYRSGGGSAPRMEESAIAYGLEKMADAFEEGANAWRRERTGDGGNVLAGTMLGIGVGFAAAVRGHGVINRFTVGPFGGLSKIGGLVTRPDVLVEMEDLPTLDDLVQQARGIPVGHVVTHGNGSCTGFFEAFDALQAKLQKRDQERDWTA